jgi:spermidine synthase
MRQGADPFPVNLVQIPGWALFFAGVIHVREPPGADVPLITQSLRDGSYAKPFVLDDGTTRRLHFDLRYVQGEMVVDDPDDLTFPYARKMMAALLFNPDPEHVIVVGLGGGALTRFCYKQLKRARVTTIEIDQDVMAFGKLFEVPAPDERARFVHGDAAEHFATSNEKADIVLVDGCDRSGTAHALTQRAFFENVRKQLRPGGLLVVNLIGSEVRRAMAKRVVASVFDNNCAVLATGDNRLMFAFDREMGTVDWARIDAVAKDLAPKHGLDFPAFARRLHSSPRL